MPLLLLALGCEIKDNPEDFDTVSFSNEGRLCLHAEIPETYGDVAIEQSFGEDAPVYVQVLFEQCASGCASDLEATCTATVSGTTVTVTGDASYRIPSEPTDCPSVCLFVAAVCETEPLTAASYAFDYGEAVVELTVPSVVDTPCDGQEL